MDTLFIGMLVIIVLLLVAVVYLYRKGKSDAAKAEETLAAEIKKRNDLQTEYNAKVAEYNAKVAELEKAKADLNAQVTGLKTQVGDLNAKVQSLTAQITSLNADIAATKISIDSLNQQLQAKGIEILRLARLVAYLQMDLGQPRNFYGQAIGSWAGQPFYVACNDSQDDYVKALNIRADTNYVNAVGLTCASGKQKGPYGNAAGTLVSAPCQQGFNKFTVNSGWGIDKVQLGCVEGGNPYSFGGAGGSPNPTEICPAGTKLKGVSGIAGAGGVGKIGFICA